MAIDKRIQDYLLKLPDNKREIALYLRDLVLLVDPRIEEGIKWGNITFFMGKFNFLFIYTFKQVSYMNLGFFFATKLSDPKNLFEGSGQTMRHIKVNSLKNIPDTHIKKWVKETLQLPEATGTKVDAKV